MNDVETKVNGVVEQLSAVIATYGLSVLGGLIILIVGWLASRWCAGALDRGLQRTSKVDATLRQFFVALTRYLILTITVLAVLSEFGIQTASLLAVFGAAGLAVGLALQGTLSNVAAGVMLLLFRPFKVGDYIDAGGHAGTVKKLDLFVTELATPDNVQILIPNGRVWGSSMLNYSFHPTRRVDFSIGIDYGDDIGKAMETIRGVITADSRCHAEPEPMIVVGALADSSVNLTVRVWVGSADYWPVKFDLTRRFKEALDAAGITIPFPQRTVHMSQAAE